jgi:O-succinylbenzoic acid--CoA ligase
MAEFLDPEQSEIVQYSSGSTGRPKRFLLPKEAMRLSARRTLAYFSLEPGMRVLACLPVEYIAGKMMLVRALVGQLELQLAEPSSSPLSAVEGNFDFAALVPLQLKAMMEAGEDLACIRQILVGGAPIPPALEESLRKLEYPALFESFAMSETISHFALRRINGPRATAAFQTMEEVRLEVDHRSCLRVDLPGITPGPVQSNDLVELAPDGRSFTWLGRADNLINSGGVKLIPEVLESRMAALLGRPCLLLPERDERLGQKLVLLVEVGHEAPPEGSPWQSILRGALSPHEVPRRIIPVKAIPLNASLKPDRQAAQTLL